MNLKKHIPNAITCGNLLCGCLAIVKCFEGNLVWAAYLVGIATVLDFFDGFAARLLKVSSAIGKDLDSLADMVTFGVVPGIIMFKLIGFAQIIALNFNPNTANSIFSIQLFAFIIPVFSAIRLAKFNNDVRQAESFIGLPTPANAIFISSLPLIITSNGQFSFNESHYLFLMQPYILCVLCFALSFLLVAPLPLFSLKFKHFKWKDNQLRFVFLALSVVLLISLQFIGIPLIIILYILLSLVAKFV